MFPGPHQASCYLCTGSDCSVPYTMQETHSQSCYIPCRRPIHRAASLSHSIPHLDNTCSPLEVVVHGSSLMPYCHFDLEQSDYLTRRAVREGKGGTFGDSRAVSDPSSTRVIEFHSCGVGIRIVR